jgi:hypothetical protein
MLSRSCKAWSERHDAYLKEVLKQGWRCAESWLWMRVSLLNILRYIFIVQRLSILSKLDSNNPYRIWAELYFLNLNYLIILDTWPIWPSWRPRSSWFTSWSYLSFSPILFAAHLLVWPSYGDNSNPRLYQLRTDGLAPTSNYWTYWSHAGDMGPISLVACSSTDVWVKYTASIIVLGEKLRQVPWATQSD